MNSKEKQEKKKYISNHIDLANGRFKDNEVDFLYDIVEHRSEYDGTTRTYKHSYDSWCSDGKYTRNEETTYTFRGDDNRVRIEEHYQYHDDDGQSGSSKTTYSTGRDILKIHGKVFGK